MPSRPESTIQQSLFEGLFVHSLGAKPGTPLAEALRRAGYDLTRQEASYPRHVWKAALEAACREAYPNLAQEAAMRELGMRFLEGFFQTLAGRAVALLAPMLGPDGVLKRMPRFFSMGTQGTEVVVHEEGKGAWRLEQKDRHPLPEFTAGILTAALLRAGVNPQVVVGERSPERFVLHLTW
ncbi:MAG TPA: DUF2378 family protein [Aggregicoccus sp.]|nr:DUF2378 family protein [Aggregicoccus sp.]